MSDPKKPDPEPEDIGHFFIGDEGVEHLTMPFDVELIRLKDLRKSEDKYWLPSTWLSSEPVRPS
jgi:hypothetical protein